MKKLFLVYILILTLSLILTGCDNGSASDSVSSSNLVKVSLTVDGDNSGSSQKTISVADGIAWNNLTYQYKAEALWTSSNIHGATIGWTTITYSNADTSLGYFTPGQWKFSVRILDGSNVIYEGSSTTYVGTTTANVIVLVSKQFENAATGQVHISVTAPTIRGENLIVSFSPDDESQGPFVADAISENGITTFECSVNGLAAGEYTFLLNYLSGSSGAAVAVNLHPGERVEISGHLDNGIWQVGYLTLKLHTINVNASCTVNTNVSSAAIGDRISFCINPLEGTILSEPISVTYGDGQTVNYTLTHGIYTFTMPDADVTINALYEGISQDINIAYLKAAVKMLYDYNPSAEKFGRVADPLANPHLKHYGVKNVTLWYDSVEKKICWHSNSDTVKLQPGSMACFFKDFATLKNIDLKGFDTSEVTSTAHMFDGCLKLQTVDLTDFDTSSVTDMSYMFYKAGYSDIPWSKKVNQQIVKVDNDHYLSITGMDGFVTENVTDMSYMFSLCSAQTLEVSSFDASHVTNFSHMFAGEWKDSYSNFKPIKVTSLALSGWNVGGNVANNAEIDMSNMFDMCNMIRTISLTDDPSSDTAGWKFARVINMKEMFNRCESATSIVFPKHTILTNVTTMLSIFCRDQQIPLTGSGSFTDIFSRWDISGNNIIEFTASPTGYGNGDSPNRLMQDTAVLKNLSSTRFNTYTSNIKVEIGSGDGSLTIDQQRLKKVVTQ